MDDELQASLPQPEEKPEEALARVMGARCAYAAPFHAQIKAEAKIYESFVFGEPPEISDSGSGKKSADEKKSARGWSQVSLPLHGVLRQVLHPTLVSRPPTFVNRVRPGADDNERALGRLYEELAKVIYRESGVHQEIMAALDDAALKRCGWLMVDFDKDKRLPRVRWVNADQVLTDRENSHSPFTRDQRWWAEFRTVPISEAKEIAEKHGKKDHEFTPLTTDVDDSDPVLLDDMQMLGADGEVLRRTNERPTEFVRLAYVYVKGANPYTGRAKNDAKPGATVSKTGEDAVYKGKDELLILECVGRQDQAESYKFIASKPWPFPTDAGECPAEPLRITSDNRDFFPFSIYQPGHSLQVAANWALRYYNTDLFNSARRVVVYTNGKIDEKALNKALYGDDNLLAIKSSGGVVGNKFFEVQDFGQPNSALKEGLPMNLGQYRDATGLDALDMEARSNRTATDAAILNQGAQVRIGFMADQVELTIRNVMRKALQCARWNMTANDVARWVSEDLLSFYNVALTERTTETQVDFDGTELEFPVDKPTGEIIRVSRLWNDNVKDPGAIRDEIGISIEPRSVRFVDPNTQIEDLQLMIAKTAEFHKRMVDAQTPQEKMQIAKQSNVAMRMLGELLNLPHWQDLLLNLEEILAIPPAAEQGQAQASLMAAARPQGPVTPQATGAAGRVAGAAGVPNPLG